MSLDPERGDKLLFRYHRMSHAPLDSFRLCQQCPQPPAASSCYMVQLAKHSRIGFRWILSIFHRNTRHALSICIYFITSVKTSILLLGQEHRQ
jgi:hypothetical protein